MRKVAKQFKGTILLTTDFKVDKKHPVIGYIDKVVYEDGVLVAGISISVKKLNEWIRSSVFRPAMVVTKQVKLKGVTIIKEAEITQVGMILK